MIAYSHVLEEQEHLGSADLDSCPDCNDVMVSRGDDKVCAGCGTRQPVITTTARHDWPFVAKMAVAVQRHWMRRTAMDGGPNFDDHYLEMGQDDLDFAREQQERDSRDAGFEHTCPGCGWGLTPGAPHDPEAHEPWCDRRNG